MNSTWKREHNEFGERCKVCTQFWHFAEKNYILDGKTFYVCYYCRTYRNWEI